MCKITTTTIKFKCHDAIYTEKAECPNTRNNCHVEYRNATIEEPRQFCRSCREEKTEATRLTIDADHRIRTHAWEMINENAKGKDKGKGKATDEYLHSYSEDGRVVGESSKVAGIKPVLDAEHDAQMTSYDSYYDSYYESHAGPIELLRTWPASLPPPAEDGMRRAVDDPSSPYVDPTSSADRNIGRWIDRVDRPSVTDSMQFAEKVNDAVDFRLNTFEESDYQAWSSDEGDMVETLPTREEIRKMKRMRKEKGEATRKREEKGKGKERAQ